jgi:two-component system, OmpR family, response regulator
MNASTTVSSEGPHLLVVDDDDEVLAVLDRYFAKQGFHVSRAQNGRQLRERIAASRIDIMLLDLGLPGEDGFELMRDLRRDWHGAIIIVTGRGDSVDRVVGLELGADDYVTKPFDLRELLARVRSVLRRSSGEPRKPTGGIPEIRFAGFTLDTDARALNGRDGVAIALTTGEFELLQAFIAAPNRVLTRDQLMDVLHGRQTGPYDRAIDVQIGRLRRKIERDPAQPELIKSVRGAGYVFTARIERTG